MIVFLFIYLIHFIHALNLHCVIINETFQSLAVEWAQSGVRINSVAPGSSIYSPTAARNYNEDNIFERARAGIPTKRLGTPQEVSTLVSIWIRY